MGSRQERGAESHIERQTLDDTQLVVAVQALIQIVDRARGPHGNIQSLHNNVGGPVTMTTSCSRLFSALSVSRPCLRLIESAIQGHLKTHHDGGLLTASLCLHLVQNAVKLESVGRVSVRDTYSVLLQLVDEYLNAENCPVVVTVDSSNLKVILGYVQNIIFTKPVAGLRLTSAGHISRLVLKAFLTTVPTTPQSFLSDQVYVLQQDKTDLMASELVEGLLLEWPEKCSQLGPQGLSVLCGTSQEVKVALVNVSMSGNVEEVPTNRVEAQQHVIQSVNDLVMTKMLAFCDWLVEQRVGVVLCQKVMHPKIKAYLRRRGVLFVERLGLQPMAYIQDLTGATLISSVMVRPADQVCGTVTQAEHCVLHGKSYLHLHKAQTCVCTLLLCAPLDQQLAELKVERKGGELCVELGIGQSQLQACVGAFVSSLESTVTSLLSPSFQAWVDSRNWHLWPTLHGVDLTTEKAPFSCGCGMLSSEEMDRNSLHLLQRTENGQLWGNLVEIADSSVCMERLKIKDSVNYDWLVLDTMDCVISAVHTAVLTACTVLSFTQFIHDVN